MGLKDAKHECERKKGELENARFIYSQMVGQDTTGGVINGIMDELKVPNDQVAKFQANINDGLNGDGY